MDLKVILLNQLANAKDKSILGLQAITAKTMDEKAITTFELLLSKLDSATQKAIKRLSERPIQSASPLSNELKDFLENFASIKRTIQSIITGISTNREAITEQLKKDVIKLALEY